MDEPNAGAKPDAKELEPRPVVEADLVALCRELNTRGARYLIVGGFAIIAAGLPRTTGDIDILVAVDPENEAKVFAALSTLPDQAIRELQSGELAKYPVVRVADEIVVDLMHLAGGIKYEEAVGETVIKEIQGVPIPFASPRLLWRMKGHSPREGCRGFSIPALLVQRAGGRAAED